MSLFVKDKSFYKNFFSLTIIIALQGTISCAVNLADNLMLGTYNEFALSGVALVNQIQFILNMLIIGVGEGIVVLSSQYWGKKDLDSIRKIIAGALRIGVGAAFLLAVVVFLFPNQVLGLFTNEQAVIDQGVGYLKIICFSYVFFAMTNIIIAGLKSVEIVKLGFFVSLSTLLINVSLNYVLIYGNFGAPELGAKGAAIATLTSRIVEFGIVLIFLWKFDDRLLLTLKSIKTISIPLLKDYIKVGLPVILSNTMWGVGMAVQAAILGHLGQTAIAANSIAATVFQILTVVSYAGASATCVITGRTIGQGDVHKIKEYTKTFQIMFLCIGICTGLGLFLVKDLVLSFYNISEATKEMASSFINVLCVTVVGTSYQVSCLTGIVRGGGDTKFVLYNDSIFIWLVVIPSSLIAAYVFNLNPVIVFMFLKCDQILKCFVAVVKTNSFTWIKKLTR